MSALHVIKNIETEIALAHDRIRAIRQACQHDWQPSNPQWLEASSPLCSKCGDRRSEWWCDTSPTKGCDYTIPGKRGFNPDNCRYCHQPDERK